MVQEAKTGASIPGVNLLYEFIHWFVIKHISGLCLIRPAKKCFPKEDNSFGFFGL